MARPAQREQSRPRTSGKRARIGVLLEGAGRAVALATIEPLGIGNAGLNARGPRDEDGTHDRVALADGTSVIYREYARTTRMFTEYRTKEEAVMRCLAVAGLPAPDILAVQEDALLLSDGGGRPLDDVFREVSAAERPPLWVEVGQLLRRLHEIPVEEAAFLDAPIYQRPWTDFVPYFMKKLRNVRAAHPDLAEAAGRLMALKDELRSWYESRPRAICCGSAGYLPGMLLVREGRSWRCTTWLSLGYYVSVTDPARDVVRIAVAHREWTGTDLPASFYRSYGSQPDPIASLVYEANIQVGRGSAYLRPSSSVNKGGRPGPPPHSTATQALKDLPATVEKLEALLR